MENRLAFLFKHSHSPIKSFYHLSEIGTFSPLHWSATAQWFGREARTHVDDLFWWVHWPPKLGGKTKPHCQFPLMTFHSWTAKPRTVPSCTSSRLCWRRFMLGLSQFAQIIASKTILVSLYIVLLFWGTTICVFFFISAVEWQWWTWLHSPPTQ